MRQLVQLRAGRSLLGQDGTSITGGKVGMVQQPPATKLAGVQAAVRELHDVELEVLARQYDSWARDATMPRLAGFWQAVAVVLADEQDRRRPGPAPGGWPGPDADRLQAFLQSIE
jgi:hypothetical protein